VGAPPNSSASIIPRVNDDIFSAPSPAPDAVIPLSSVAEVLTRVGDMSSPIVEEKDVDSTGKVVEVGIAAATIDSFASKYERILRLLEPGDDALPSFVFNCARIDGLDKHGTHLWL
jgi:hypothetical protein